MATGLGVELLRVQAERRRDPEELLHQVARTLDLADDRKRGRELCERLLKDASSLGLYAEELESASGRHLGNFPQAFTHLALINAVTHVIRASGRRRSHGFAPANKQA